MISNGEFINLEKYYEKGWKKKKHEHAALLVILSLFVVSLVTYSCSVKKVYKDDEIKKVYAQNKA